MNIKIIFDKIETFFSTGHERSVKAKKNIIGLVISKGLSIFISLLLVRLTINYVNPTNYGIWITLSSIIAWMSFFDIGFGNGLRNKFAEARATGNEIKARNYISTTYAILSIIFSVVWIIFFFIHFFVDWSYILLIILHRSEEHTSELQSPCNLVC